MELELVRGMMLKHKTRGVCRYLSRTIRNDAIVEFYRNGKLVDTDSVKIKDLEHYKKPNKKG